MKRLFLCIIFLLTFGVAGFSQDAVSSTIEFVVNTNRFVENGKYYDYKQKIIPLIRKKSDEIEHIYLIGSASPEGNYEANRRLAMARLDKIYSELSRYISGSKITTSCDYELFLRKTGYSEKDFPQLRATYIEVCFKEKEEKKDTVRVEKRDTVQIEKRDTVRLEKRDTFEIEKTIEVVKIDTVFREAPAKVDTVFKYIGQEPQSKCDKLVFSVETNLSGYFIKAPGINVEFYFSQLSFFAEGNFANTTLKGKDFNFDLWHTGLRKYFNDNYDKVFIEVYGRTGYFDMDVFWDDCGKFGIPFGAGFGLGYKFSLCSHIKIYPFFRIGYDYVKFCDYYIYDGGNVGVSFNQYVDGKNGSTETKANGVTFVEKENRVISKEFFEKAKTAHWFGPTYIGFMMQLDLHKKNKNE